MPSPEAERNALVNVARITVATGAMQAVVPRLTLDRLVRRPDALSTHLFATVGMFMTVSGGVLSAALDLPDEDSRRVLAWCAAQKLGASAAVAIGVRRKVLSPMALAVAGFDLLSGLLVLDYARHQAR